MTTKRSLIATPSTFVDIQLAGANYVLPLDPPAFENFLVALVNDGTLLSTDKGATWGSPFGLAEGGPWGVIYQIPAGAYAGRYIALPLGSGLQAYVSVDSGVTYAAKSLFYTLNNKRGAKIVFGGAPSNYTWLRRTDERNTSTNQLYLMRTADGGINFTATLFNSGGRPSVGGYGAGLETRVDGSVYVFGSLTTQFTTMDWSKSINEGTSFSTETPLNPTGTLWESQQIRSGYHYGDDVIGVVANKISAGENDPIVFITLDASDTLVYTYIPTDVLGTVLEIDWLSAIPGITGKWCISCRTATESLWLVSDDGDPTTWSVLETHGIATMGEGILGNLVQWGVATP